MRSRTLVAMIKEGTIAIDTELVSHGSTVKGLKAKIVRDGIDLGGNIHRTPSAAARAVAGYSVNGWDYWRVKASGQTLASLRPQRTEEAPK